MVTLCQGAAAHYLDRTRGINDFDVYSFYSRNPCQRWCARRLKPRDFGSPKFGRSVDRPGFVGRRIDLMGRDIDYQPPEDPRDALRRWIAVSSAKTPAMLRRSPVVALWPEKWAGDMIWRPARGQGAV